MDILIRECSDEENAVAMDRMNFQGKNFSDRVSPRTNVAKCT